MRLRVARRAKPAYARTMVSGPLLAVVLVLGLGPPDSAGWTRHATRLAAAGDAESTLRLAFGLARRGPVDEALVVCAEAARKGAHPLRVALARGEALYRGERYEEAAALFHEVVVAAPENDFAVAMLWMSLRYVRLTVETPSLDLGALRALLDARGLPTPESSHVPPQTSAANERVRAADQAARGGRFDAAVQGYRTALEHDDLLPDVWRGLAMAQTRLGNARAARMAWTLFVWTAEAAGRSRDKHDLRQARRLLADEARRRGLAAARGAGRRSSPVTGP